MGKDYRFISTRPKTPFLAILAPSSRTLRLDFYRNGRQGKLQNERLLGKIEKLKDQSDFWDELTPEEQARIEVGIKDLDAGRKTSYESIIASHRQK